MDWNVEGKAAVAASIPTGYLINSTRKRHFSVNMVWSAR
jgi:hypothetical protein